MPVIIIEGDVMRNTPKASSNAINKDALEAIEQLTYDKIWRSSKFNPISQTSKGLVRIDVQNPLPNGGPNLQVQINGISKPSTIATVLIDPNLAYTETDLQQEEVITNVKLAFVSSLESYKQGNPTIYKVNGGF